MGDEQEEHLTACDGCGRVWDSAVPHECFCVCQDGDEQYEAWRDATKAEAFLYHGWWRVVEQTRDLQGYDLTKAVTQRLDAMTQALNRSNADEGWKNLVGAVATALTYAAVNGRWAVYSGRRNEELRGMLREARTMLTSEYAYDPSDLLSRIDAALALEEPIRPSASRLAAP
jgi:hypothetical protein